MARNDANGLFWETEVKTIRQRGAQGTESKDRSTKTKTQRIKTFGPLPATPDTGWRPPTEFPRLDSAKMISIDVETYDPELTTKGPGPRRDGRMVGICVGTDDGSKWYFPFGHSVGTEYNLPEEAVIAWARDNLSGSQDKVGANMSYDLDYLESYGVKVGGRLLDVQIAEPLLDENRFSYSLNILAQEYLGTGKVSSELQKWVSAAYREPNYRKEIWRCSPIIVGPYGEGDAHLPIEIISRQLSRLESEGLMPLFDIESRLIRPLLAMRRRGVRVDIPAAMRLDDDLSARIDLAQSRLNSAAGGPIDVNLAVDLKRLFDREGVEYPRTDKGNPSFTKEWLEQGLHPACIEVMEVRKLTKYRDTFVRGYILNSHINGRIHGLFHQLKGDENGTVSGRMASSNPNLQNIPSRDPEWGWRIRALFLPEEGEYWGRHDWSQIEYRFLAHFARGPGSDEIRRRYSEDPTTDYHEMTLDLVAPAASWDISTPSLRKERRKPVKNINFGLCYGMGEAKLAADLHLNRSEASQLFGAYHTAVPFVKMTYDAASNVAKERGYIVTVLGRRARFDLWQDSSKWNSIGYPLVRAQQEYSGKPLSRAYTHKALNRLLQGSAADLMKVAMVNIFESGIPSVLGSPLVTVHDELGHSVPKTSEGIEAMREVKNIMESCMKLRVPIIAEEELGPSWGEVK